MKRLNYLKWFLIGFSILYIVNLIFMGITQKDWGYIIATVWFIFWSLEISSSFNRIELCHEVIDLADAVGNQNGRLLIVIEKLKQENLSLLAKNTNLQLHIDENLTPKRKVAVKKAK